MHHFAGLAGTRTSPDSHPYYITNTSLANHDLYFGSEVKAGFWSGKNVEMAVQKLTMHDK